MSFPIIDISNVDDPEHQLMIAQQITNASKQWGFLLIKSHPIPPSHVQEMFTLAKDFFSLPEDEKTPWPINKNEIGYVGSFKDRKPTIRCPCGSEVSPELSKATTQHFLPTGTPESIKSKLFKHECHTIVLKLLVCFAIAMDLPDSGFFAKAHDEYTGKSNSFRMLMYPARSEMPQNFGSRMIQHMDVGPVTLLFQQAPGLEVPAPSGEWVNAPCEKYCILVNLGDTLSFWSGNQLKATLHRVIFDGLPHDKERQSMAYFGAANPDTVLQPLLSGVTMGEYHSNGFVVKPGITVGELNKQLMSSIYGPTPAA